MKPDLYTKAVLTVIAVMLTVIAARQVAQPASVSAESDKAPTENHFAVGPDGTFYFYVDHTGVIGAKGPKGEKRPDIFLKY